MSGRDGASGRAWRVVLALLFVAGCRSERRPAPAYNVLLLSLDTVRQDVLGCYGHRARRAPDVPVTPALDALAGQGVRMVDAYAPSSWTLPSHLSLLTGRPPLVHGVETEVHALDASIRTMAEVLGANGYRTFGVYSAPYLDPHWGFGRGFEEYRAVYGTDVAAAAARAAAQRAAVDAAAAAGDWPRYDALKREEVDVDRALNDASQHAVTSDDVTAAVAARLAAAAHDDRPWFVFGHFFDAHCDYVPPPPYDTRFDPDYRGSFTGGNCMRDPVVGAADPARPGGLVRALPERDLEHAFALYEGEVAWVDAHVGAILAALDASGQAARTLVVVVSDHGEEFFEHGGVGHRRTLYEEVVRVPMLLRLPGVLPAGVAVRGAVSLTDVLPTVLDVLGMPGDATPGAASVLPLVRGAADPSSRGVLERLAMMYEGDVELEGGRHVTFRQVVVDDVFRTGALKVTRTRSWPQFPGGLPADVTEILAAEAARQYAQERVRWIDVDRFPAEPDEGFGTTFADAAPRRALDAFRDLYARLLPLRVRATAGAPVPENVRRNLESLGYVDPDPGATFPEPDVALPPPRAD